MIKCLAGWLPAAFGDASLIIAEYYAPELEELFDFVGLRVLEYKSYSLRWMRGYMNVRVEFYGKGSFSDDYLYATVGTKRWRALIIKKKDILDFIAEVNGTRIAAYLVRAIPPKARARFLVGLRAQLKTWYEAYTERLLGYKLLDREDHDYDMHLTTPAMRQAAEKRLALSREFLAVAGRKPSDGEIGRMMYMESDLLIWHNIECGPLTPRECVMMVLDPHQVARTPLTAP